MVVEEAAATIVKVKGASAAGLGGVLHFLFFTKLRWTITIILVLITLISATGDCIKEKSFFPLIEEVGGKLLSADEGLFWKIKDIENNGWRIPSKDIEFNEEPSFWRDIKSVFAKFSLVFDVLSTFWYIYIVGFWFYLLFKIFNTSGTIFFNIAMAVLVVLFLQSAYGSTMLYLNDDCGADSLDKCISLEEKYTKAAFSLTPLKGLGYFGLNLFNGNLIPAFAESAVGVVEIVPLNQSLNVSRF